MPTASVIAGASGRLAEGSRPLEDLAALVRAQGSELARSADRVQQLEAEVLQLEQELAGLSSEVALLKGDAGEAPDVAAGLSAADATLLAAIRARSSEIDASFNSGLIRDAQSFIEGVLVYCQRPGSTTSQWYEEVELSGFSQFALAGILETLIELRCPEIQPGAQEFIDDAAAFEGV